MSLENKVHNKTNVFKRIAGRAVPYVLAAGLGLAVMGCQEAPGILPDKENNKQQSYQGPVRLADDEQYFRETGVIRPLTEIKYVLMKK
jgi:hypothetical protein